MAKDKTKKKSGKKKQAGKKHDVPMAQLADRYALYGKSVQEPEHELEFFDAIYQEIFGRKAFTLREDFCGTFAVCCEWVKSDPKRTAVGVDLDEEPLAWGKEHHLAKLTEDQQSRVTLLKEDVRSKGKVKCELLAAQNFSFWIFKTRDALREYFKYARQNLADDGLMLLDMMGGYDCFEEEHEDVRKINRKVKYVWEQHSFNPITHDGTFYIHFRFQDGSELPRAFEYHWRFWSIPEVRELLAEAGFSDSWVYWEKEDEDGDGTGDFERVEDARSDPSWIAYIVAKK